jgi:hypothetical protein
MPSTLTATLVKGKLLNLPDLPKDTLQLSGTFVLGAEALATAFDSTVHAFSLRLGTYEASPLVNIPAADAGWKLRRGVYTWKSPIGSITKAKVTIRSSTGEWKVKLSRVSLPPTAAGTLRFTVGVGTDAGHVETEWIPGRRQGQLKFP